MDDLISRQAAIEALGERPYLWTGDDYELGCANQYDSDKLAIETVPSAQPERKRGKWENICSLQNWQYTYEHYRCSNCGIPAECAFRYCPHCGAEMEQ